VIAADLPPQHPLVRLSDAVYAIAAKRVRGPRAFAEPPGLGMSAERLAGGRYEAMAYTTERHVVVDAAQPSFLRAATRLGGRWSRAQELSVAVLVHEHMHILGSGHESLRGTPADRGVEEAIVDALAADTLPAVVRSLSGRRSLLAGSGWAGVYPACVARLRVASTVAAGDRSWRGPRARAWRVRMLHAGPESRATALRATGTDPASVCP
jgi:hypothetical protein